MSELDQARIDDAYDVLNTLWRLHGVEALAAAYQRPHPRAAVLGLHHSEVDRVIAGVRTFFAWGRAGDWVAEWTTAGSEYERLFEDANGKGYTVTAVEMLRLASVCYFFGGYVHNHLVPVPAAERARLMSIETYRRAAPGFALPAERLEFEVDGAVVAGYLRRPRLRQQEPVPCVVILGGANSNKEENHPLAEQFVARGMATFVYDGPGQGEYLLTNGRPHRASTALSTLQAVLGVLAGVEGLDPHRAGLFGRSGAGIIALQAAAAHLPGLVAVVAHPGVLDWAETLTDAALVPVRLEIAHWLGASSLADLDDLMRRELRLSEPLTPTGCPVLSINGRFDSTAPPEGLRSAIDSAGDRLTVVSYPTRDHGGPPNRSWALAADWMSTKLGVH